MLAGPTEIVGRAKARPVVSRQSGESEPDGHCRSLSKATRDLDLSNRPNLYRSAIPKWHRLPAGVHWQDANATCGYGFSRSIPNHFGLDLGCPGSDSTGQIVDIPKTLFLEKCGGVGTARTTLAHYDNFLVARQFSD